VVEVNVEETALSADVSAVLRGAAGEVLPAIEEAL
jgi:NAD-dependent SIR2 family protein deacetylase